MKESNHIILYADDDPDDREFFIFAARQSGVDIVTFASGQELLSYLQGDIQPIEKLIFIDINMPIMSGFECVKSIRSIKGNQNNPIMIYSTSNDQSDIEQAEAYGANAYIVKPSNLNVLKSVILKIININWEHEKKFMVFSKR